jgi:hypothetical protein
MLWKRVLPMLRSCRILVPLRLAIGFNTAISSLEKVAWSPEQIELVGLGRVSSVTRDGGSDQRALCWS